MKTELARQLISAALQVLAGPQVSPDEYKRQHGKCPKGYYSNKNGKCEKSGLVKKSPTQPKKHQNLHVWDEESEWFTSKIPGHITNTHKANEAHDKKVNRHFREDGPQYTVHNVVKHPGMNVGICGNDRDKVSMIAHGTDQHKINKFKNEFSKWLDSNYNDLSIDTATKFAHSFKG